MLDPITDPQAWDFVTFADNNTPGTVVVTGFEIVHDVDRKKGKGTLGSTSTLTGIPPASGSMKFTAWLPAHFAVWSAILPLFKYDPTKGKSLAAVDTYYPAFGSLSLVADKIGRWTPDGEATGRYTMTIALTEYTPEEQTKKNATSTASGSTSQSTAGGGGTAPPGTQPDPEIVELQNQAAQLAKDAAAAYA